MLFIMLAKEYPFDKREENVESTMRAMMDSQWRLPDEVDKKCAKSVKNLIGVLLEPDPKKRPDVFVVCCHKWIPIIHRETELLGLVPNTARRTSTPSGS